MFTPEQTQAVAARRALFITAMLYLADATPQELRAMGLQTKEQGLIKEVKRFREDLHKILKD